MSSVESIWGLAIGYGWNALLVDGTSKTNKFRGKNGDATKKIFAAKAGVNIRTVFDRYQDLIDH